MTISFRRANNEDVETLLEWRNNPLTRKNSLNMDEVTPDEHIEWLKQTLGAPNRQLFMAEEGGVEVGTIREDFFNNTYELSWTVSPDARGRGFGKRMVRAYAEQIRGPIIAKIKRGNMASVKIAIHIGMKKEYEKDGLMYWTRDAPGRSGKEG